MVYKKMKQIQTNLIFKIVGKKRIILLHYFKCHTH